MIISDLNYIETAPEASIEGGGDIVIAKAIDVDIKQQAFAKAFGIGGLNQVAILGSKVGSITANTNVTANASNNAQFSIDA